MLTCICLVATTIFAKLYNQNDYVDDEFEILDDVTKVRCTTTFDKSFVISVHPRWSPYGAKRFLEQVNVV